MYTENLANGSLKAVCFTSKNGDDKSINPKIIRTEEAARQVSYFTDNKK